MLYEARIRRSSNNQKWMFFLGLNGHTIKIGDACYSTRDTAIAGARRAACDHHDRTAFPRLSTRAAFRVDSEESKMSTPSRRPS